MLKKLSSPQIKDVYQPARDQFNGRGSFGNGGAMRAAPFALAFPDLADVKKVRSRVRKRSENLDTVTLFYTAKTDFVPLQFTQLGAMLTHSCSLGYNGAVLQALAVHLSLQGALELPQQFISRLIAEMEEVEGDEAALRDARM